MTQLAIAPGGAALRNKHRLFRIVIYRNGVERTARVRGKERYLREIAFLNALTGLPRAGPPGEEAFYALDDDQLAIYSAFRGRLRKEALKTP